VFDLGITGTSAALRKHDRRFDRHTKGIRAILAAIQALIRSSEPQDQNVLKPVGFDRTG
jgi:hypothetical protein